MKHAELIKKIRELVLQGFYGTFVTQGFISQGFETQGQEYPYASLARYSVDSQGQPILMLSRIAKHTKNINNSDKVSLFIIKANEENIQECERITLMGSLESLNKEHADFKDCLRTYYAYFPETQDYYENLDFDLYRLNIETCAYVGGFAAAHKIIGDDYRQNNPLDNEACTRILSHMNSDHSDAIEHYCNTFDINFKGETPCLVAVDALGFQLRIGKRIERINFPEAITDRVSAREAFVAMSRSL